MGVPEAPLEDTGAGVKPAGPGWFVLNVRDARWFGNELGRYALLDSEDARFEQIGVAVGVILPGQPNAMYHAEDAQEDFLVLSGECTLVVEDEERRLKAWDFFHCAPGTHHIIVGAGDGPCAILMVGSRAEGKRLHYPVSEVAGRHGASTPEETDAPSVAYSDLSQEYEPLRATWPL